ncbi:hypothetical protein [Photobacterium sanguinicancri]|uniref:Uncharacterized protein n=1 Tax=Photobacterium sanguinicancri TaxID=875932 RepID=A0AAW7Y1C4_9GAMM|nr:hypothetical protein [Photobacterium sanguinicancri]MDO6542161.1 hypothetical protein [Photobacterium sanguinicancri]
MYDTSSIQNNHQSSKVLHQPSTASPSIDIRCHSPMTRKYLLNELKALRHQLPQHCFSDGDYCLTNIVELDFRAALNTTQSIAPDLIDKKTIFKIAINNDLSEDIPQRLAFLTGNSDHSNEVNLALSSHLLLNAVCQRYQVQRLNPIQQSLYSIWLNQLVHFVIARQQVSYSPHRVKSATSTTEKIPADWGQFDPNDEYTQQWTLDTVLTNCYYEGIATLTQWLCGQATPELLGIQAAKRFFNHHVHPIQKIASPNLANTTNINWIIYENSDILYAFALKTGPWMALEYASHHQDRSIRKIALSLLNKYKHEGSWGINLEDRNTFIHTLIQQDINHVVHSIKQYQYPILKYR